ncbi:porin [Paraburkholderia bannensis]|nr:porin [Paraburkholderia bannensis]
MLLVICANAHAQSSVTLYGMLDAGMTYTNNVTTSSGHSSSLQLSSGSSVGDHWGITGREDIGGGVAVIFKLESGFWLANGAMAVNDTLFSREATVGFDGPAGTVKIGRQYDFIGDSFWSYSIAGNSAAGLMAWGLPTYAAGGYSLDNRMWGVTVNNAVKYVSPSLDGLRIGGMYGFGNVAGSMGTSQSVNVLLDYGAGNFHGSISYFSEHNASGGSNLMEYAGGASYVLGDVKVFGVVTYVQLSSGDKPRAITYDGGMSYNISPSLAVGTGIQFQTRNNGIGSANQMTASVDYFLSKSTDLYIVAAVAHDSAYGAEIQAVQSAPASTTLQTAARIGIRHAF